MDEIPNNDPYHFDTFAETTDRRMYAERHGYRSLGIAQRSWAAWCDRVTATDTTRWRMVGISRIGCPTGGPWPRAGEAGRDERAWDAADIDAAREVEKADS